MVYIFSPLYLKKRIALSSQHCRDASHKIVFFLKKEVQLKVVNIKPCIVVDINVNHYYDAGGGTCRLPGDWYLSHLFLTVLRCVNTGYPFSKRG